MPAHTVGMWLDQKDEERISLRGVGPFTPADQVVFISMEPGLTNNQLMLRVIEEYERRGLKLSDTAQKLAKQLREGH